MCSPPRTRPSATTTTTTTSILIGMEQKRINNKFVQFDNTIIVHEIPRMRSSINATSVRKRPAGSRSHRSLSRSRIRNPPIITHSHSITRCYNNFHLIKNVDDNSHQKIGLGQDRWSCSTSSLQLPLLPKRKDNLALKPVRRTLI